VRSFRVALLIGTLLGLGRPSAITAQNGSIAEQTTVGRPLLGAVLGSAAGGLVGGITGLYIGGNRCIDPGASDTCDWLRGMAVGTTIGVTLGAPVGAHLLNSRRGSLPLSVLASAAIGTAGVLAFRNLEDNPLTRGRNNAIYTIMIGVPVLQVVSSTLIEMRTSPK
jgi:hypothetical protein